MAQTDNWLVHEHSLYETLLSRCQEAAEVEDWETVDRSVHELVTHLKRHMALEEEVLFPAYEQEPYAPQGPTTALRAEHDTIVRLIRDSSRVIRTRQSEAVLESLARLEYQMIKHHEKEEDIFLPMAGLILDGRREALLRRLADFYAVQPRRQWDI